jgi:hypothetical protein
MNTITAIAEPKSLSQGIYNAKDSKFLIGTSYTIQNTSPNDKAFIMIIDGDQQIQELIRLEPNSSKYYIKPLQYDYLIVIIGKGQLVFS